MPMPLFDAILKELRYKINYDAVVNYAGNSFVSDSWELIRKSDPFNVDSMSNDGAGMGGFAQFLSANNIQVKKKE